MIINSVNLKLSEVRNELIDGRVLLLTNNHFSETVYYDSERDLFVRDNFFVMKNDYNFFGWLYEKSFTQREFFWV